MMTTWGKQGLIWLHLKSSSLSYARQHKNYFSAHAPLIKVQLATVFPLWRWMVSEDLTSLWSHVCSSLQEHQQAGKVMTIAFDTGSESYLPSWLRHKNTLLPESIQLNLTCDIWHCGQDPMLRPFQWWPTIRNLVQYLHFRIILLSLLTIDWNSPLYRVRHCFLNAVQTPHLPYMQSWNKPQFRQQGSWLLSWTYRAICLGPWDRVHQAQPLQSPYLQTHTGNTWQWFQNESV